MQTVSIEEQSIKLRAELLELLWRVEVSDLAQIGASVVVIQ